MCGHLSQSMMLFMFNDNLLRTFSRYQSDDAQRFRRGAHAADERPAAERQSDPVTIRHAHPADLRSLERLAALDSRRLPSGELFVAEVGDQLVAAVSIDTGAVIADPFEPTAAIVDLLRVHADAVRPQVPHTAKAARAAAQAATVN
jgi:hypothetical protein